MLLCSCLEAAEGQRALEGEWFGLTRLMSKLMWDWLPFSEECSGAKPLSTSVDEASGTKIML